MAIEEGTIKIEPFTEEQLNPVSYDLTLGDGVAVYGDCVLTGKSLEDDDKETGAGFFPIRRTLDVKEEPKVCTFKMTPEKGWVLLPGIGYLMHTRERVSTSGFVPIIDGKSSIGRLFITVHVTAGYVDPGFAGQYTLEVVCQHPVRVYPGMRIAQVRFHTIAGVVDKLYSQVGHYTGEHAQGAVGSQAWRQFKRD